MSLFKLHAAFFNEEVKVIQPTLFNDERGYFSVSYREDEFESLGLPTQFVQDNHSRSAKGVVRGLHFQLDPPMGKLMRVTRGMACLVSVDIRPESPTFLKWHGVIASEWNCLQVWAPAYFARGFYAMEDGTEVQYKCTEMQNPASDCAILWNDPDIAVNWQVENPILSERDKNAPTVKEWLEKSRSDS